MEGLNIKCLFYHPRLENCLILNVLELNIHLMMWRNLIKISEVINISPNVGIPGGPGPTPLYFSINYTLHCVLASIRLNNDQYLHVSQIDISVSRASNFLSFKFLI